MPHSDPKKPAIIANGQTETAEIKASSARSPGRPKSDQKRKQILHGASELLLSKGYSNTSMDAVAKASGVSKQTVYSHFTNKDALYNAIIESKCQQYQIEEASICINTQALEDILYQIGHRFIQLLRDDNVVAMYKLVIGESNQNTHVAQLFYDAGPLHSVKIVAKLLAQHPQSQLSNEHATEMAHDFFNLLKGDFHMMSMLHLPVNFDQESQLLHAQKVAQKTVTLIGLYSA